MKKTPAMNEAESRPEWFDEKLLSYMPAIKKLARKYYPSDPEEVAQEAAAWLLKNWRSYRVDGGFYGWIYWHVRYIAKTKREYNERRSGIRVPLDEELTRALAVEPTQDGYVTLSQVFDYANETSDGRIVLRRAMGEGLGEIGADYGITRQRIQQLEARGRTLCER